MERTNKQKNIEIIIGEDYPSYVEGNSDTVFNFIVPHPENAAYTYLNFDPENALWSNCASNVNPAYWQRGYESGIEYSCQYNCQCQYSPGNYVMTIQATTISFDSDLLFLSYCWRIEIQVQ